MLTVNNCLEAFWLGSLKNRDLQVCFTSIESCEGHVNSEQLSGSILAGKSEKPAGLFHIR